MSESFLPSTSHRGETDDETPTPESGKWRQYYTCFAMFVVCISKGFSWGWSSPMIQILEKDSSPVGKMDAEQINILQTSPLFAGILGNILVAITLAKCGTKTSGYIQAMVLVGGWALVLVANTPMVLYIGRFLVGVCQVDAVGAFYLSEVVHDTRRGTLISAAMFGMSLGNILAFLLGSLCGWVVFNAICIVPAAVFPFLLIPIPEAPSYLVRKGRSDAAARSFSWFFAVGSEPAKRKVAELNATQPPKVTPATLFMVKSNRRALLIFTFIVGFTPLCGTSVIAAYNSQIFEKARSTISPNQSALMMATISFLASICSTQLIDRVGRRFLIVVSLGVMSVSLSAVSTYFFLEDGKWTDILAKEPLLYGGLGFYSAACMIGIWSVSSTVGAELVPGEIKGLLWMVSGIIGMLVSAASLQVYEIISAHFPYYTYFFQAAGLSLLSCIIASAIVPETKGKSLTQITAELNGVPLCPTEDTDQQETYGPIDDSFSVNNDCDPILYP